MGVRVGVGVPRKCTNYMCSLLVIITLCTYVCAYKLFNSLDLFLPDKRVCCLTSKLFPTKQATSHG